MQCLQSTFNDELCFDLKIIKKCAVSHPECVDMLLTKSK
jgi:hypothetical protein